MNSPPIKSFFTFLFLLVLNYHQAGAQSGIPDPSFGDTGVVFTDLHLANENSRALEQSPDGKLRIEVGTPTGTYLIKLLANGEQDTAFGKILTSGFNFFG